MISASLFAHYRNLLNHPDKRQQVDALQDLFFLLLNGELLHPDQWELLIPILVSNLASDDDSTLRRWKYQVASFSVNNNKMLVDCCINNLGKEPDTENRTWITSILAKNLPQRQFHNVLYETDHRLTKENVELCTYLFNDSPRIDVKGVLMHSNPISIMWLASIGAYKNIAKRRGKEQMVTSRELTQLIKETDNDEVLKHIMYAFCLQDQFKYSELMIRPEAYTKMGDQQKKWFFTLAWRDQEFVSLNIDFFQELTGEKNLFFNTEPEVRIGLARGLANSRYYTELSRNILEWYSHEDQSSAIYYLMKFFQRNQACSKEYQAIVDYQKNHGSVALRELVSIVSHDVSFRTKEAALMTKKNKKVFISHSHMDESYANHFVDLLESIGLTSNQIICSTVAGTSVPLGDDIYECLRTEFETSDLHIIFLLSKNYYHSVACLNEMGAAWALRKRSTMILLPGFKFKEIEGAVNPREIGIKLDDGLGMLRDRLGQLRDILLEEFQLPNISESRWEKRREAFIESVAIK